VTLRHRETEKALEESWVGTQGWGAKKKGLKNDGPRPLQ